MFQSLFAWQKQIIIRLYSLSFMTEIFLSALRNRKNNERIILTSRIDKLFIFSSAEDSFRLLI